MQAESLHVVFGSGPAGRALADALTEKGRRVRVVNRSGQADTPAGAELVGGDAADPAFTREVCAGATVVYNCLNPGYRNWPEAFPPLQDGVLAGAAAAGAKLVSMENLYMYGPTAGRPLREDLPYAAQTRKGKTRAKMALGLLEAHRQGQVRVAIGRASDFFGPGALESAMGERAFVPALEGKRVQVIGDPDLPHTYSYVPDIGQALVTLGERDEALGQAWHIPNPRTVSTSEFLQIASAHAGHRSRVQRVPKIALRAFGLINANVKELVEMLYEFEEPFIVDHSRYTDAFGNAATPLEDAIAETVRWFRDHESSSADAVARSGQAVQ